MGKCVAKEKIGAWGRLELLRRGAVVVAGGEMRGVIICKVLLGGAIKHGPSASSRNKRALKLSAAK